MRRILVFIMGIILVMSIVSCSTSSTSTTASPTPTTPAAQAAAISINSTILKQGDKVTIYGAGFTPDTEVIVEIMAPYVIKEGTQTYMSYVWTTLSSTEKAITLKANKYSAFKLENIIPTVDPGIYPIRATDAKGITAYCPVEILKK
ncbi:MAG: hypothetical protein Q7R34_12750 [Dehalococcoidia bacterium]|nr:hypothetical protein [Dehalococcoidia bacterium]